ncbi:MAG TPA: hypothetical protein VLB27_00095, partial [candidate division Zixibacteria bacterium]|nr:hypothetical protein [candidate division Zixibacteria bacterium]
MISRTCALTAAAFSFVAALAGATFAAPAPGWWVETPLTIAAHSLRAAVGGAYTVDAPFPYSGLNGDLTDYGWLEIRLAPSESVELFTHGVIRRALSVDSISQLSGGPELQQPVALGQTRSVTGDFSLYAK